MCVLSLRAKYKRFKTDLGIYSEVLTLSQLGLFPVPDILKEFGSSIMEACETGKTVSSIMVHIDSTWVNMYHYIKLVELMEFPTKSRPDRLYGQRFKLKIPPNNN